MCEPMTIATVGAMAVGTGISIYAKQQEGSYQAQIARNNAKISEWQAADAAQIGGQEASAVQTAARQAGATQLAKLAASGVDTTTGSAAASLASTAAEGALAAETARANAARRAWGYSNESQDLQAQAKMIRRGSILGGIGLGLSGAAGALGTGYSMHKAAT